MNNQNKFMTRWITWVVMPDGYTYMSPIIEDSKDACESRYGEKDHDWSGYKFIHVPIDVPVPDEVVVKIIQEEHND